MKKYLEKIPRLVRIIIGWIILILFILVLLPFILIRLAYTFDGDFIKNIIKKLGEGIGCALGLD